MRTRTKSDPKAGYESYLRRKVEAGRASMQAGRGRPNEKVEATFDVRRKRQAASRA